MRRAPWILLLALIAVVLAQPAFAQGATNPYAFTWAALAPGNDWAAQVLASVFPIPGFTGGTMTGTETTAITQIVGSFTAFIGAIACAFVVYNVLMHIHRAAESARVLGSGQSSIFVVRVGFAAIMMFPIGGGFSVGQMLVMQGAMYGIGMARVLYTSAIQAIGPDAIVIARPMIPGTGKIVEGLIDSELCMDLVNLAASTTNGNGGPLIPIPQPIRVDDNYNSGYIMYRYSLSTGNEWGNPACGTVTVAEAARNQQTVAGVSVDMAAVQQAVLGNVLNGSIRNQVAAVAQNLWQTRQASALTPLQDIYTSAVSTYTSQLTAQATSIASALSAAVQANATQARNGNSDLLQSEVQQSTLGWTAAGAYYLEIAKLNASTLSLLNATPITTSPIYDGLGTALSYDLAPLEAAQRDFMTTLDYAVQTADGTNAPNGVPHTLADAKGDGGGASVLEQIFGRLNLTNGILTLITNYILPTTQIWTDPFGGLMQLGQLLINTSLTAMGTAAVLSSVTASTGAAIWQTLTFNWGAAAATVAGHAIMSFLGTPIFIFLAAMLTPGIIIAYVLPMIPYVMWMAGVAGWLILVCEAMVAVPVWMLAHMTVGGDGLHGRAIEGWGLLFNVVFRPPLMIIGLFLSYFVFDCMSWLIRESFGIAAGFVLANGGLVSNFVGIVALLSIFVMLHVATALMSFRMVALLPHHLPRLLGFTAANRVDMEDFQHRSAWGVGGEIAGGSRLALKEGSNQFGQRMETLPRGPAGYISHQRGASGSAASDSSGMDSTLRATSGTSSPAAAEDDDSV